MGGLFSRPQTIVQQAPPAYAQGVPQNNYAMQAAQQTSTNDQAALQFQQSQNQIMQQQQNQLSQLVASRTAALQAQIAPSNQYQQPTSQMQALPTMQTSVFGDTSTAQTNRSRLFGN